MNGLALCAGIGGLELGLKLALGDTYRCVGYVEREAFAASILVARMEDAALDRAPIWDDLATFNGKPWRGRVDLVSAGFPCQDISRANQHAPSTGIAGARSGLWTAVLRVLDECAAPVVFLENVDTIVSRGLDVVLQDLASIGFDAEWCRISAADVGAPHGRPRWFCLAYTDGEGRRLIGQAHNEDWNYAPRHDANGCGSAILQSRSDVRPRRELHVPSVFPPRPSESFDGWVAQGLPEPGVFRGVNGPADGVDDPNRRARLAALGNGVVPLAAAHAFRILAARAMSYERQRVVA